MLYFNLQLRINISKLLNDPGIGHTGFNVIGDYQINHCQEKYRQALEYMQWFEPAWTELSDEEKFILEEFYMQGSLRSGASLRVQAKMDCSPRQVERLRSKSLERLMYNLYGR